MGSSHLSSIGNPINTPLRLGFSYGFQLAFFHLQREKEREREREREPNLPSCHYSHFGIPRSWLESSDGRSWVYETFKLFLLYIELSWEHLDPGMYEYNISRSIVNCDFYYHFISL